MHAVMLYEYGGPNNLKYQEAPDPSPASGEVLVRTAATSVNPFDLKVRAGEAKEKVKVEFPYILGVDLAGTVLALGEGVTGFKLGDRVMAMTSKAYAEQVVVKATDLALIPENLDTVGAAALPLVVLTGQQLIMNGVRPERGWTVLISGAVGSVGRSAVFAAKQAGATVIAGVRRRQMKDAEAIEADRVIAIDDDSEVAKLSSLDAVADTVNHDTAQRLMEKVRKGGVFASVLGPPANAHLHPTVRVEAVATHPNAGTLRDLAEAVAIKKLIIPIDRVMPLAHAAEAQRLVEKGGIGKIVLST